MRTRTRTKFKLEESPPTEEIDNKENMPVRATVKRETQKKSGSSSKVKKSTVTDAKAKKAARAETGNQIVIDSLESETDRKSVRFSEADEKVSGTYRNGRLNDTSSSRISATSIEESAFKILLKQSSNSSTPLRKLSPRSLNDTKDDITDGLSIELQGEQAVKVESKNINSVDLQHKGDIETEENYGKRKLRDRKRMSEIGNIKKSENNEESKQVEKKSKASQKNKIQNKDEEKPEETSTKDRSHNLSKSFLSFEAKSAKNEEVLRQLELERKLLEDFNDIDSFELCIE